MKIDVKVFETLTVLFVRIKRLRSRAAINVNGNLMKNVRNGNVEYTFLLFNISITFNPILDVLISRNSDLVHLGILFTILYHLIHWCNVFSIF